MKILLDHCVPKRFRKLLPGHNVRTTYEMGWADFTNGRLLTEATSKFDVFLTVDQGLQFQQNLASLPMPVVILVVPNNRFETLVPLAQTVLQALLQIQGRQVLRITGPGQIQLV